MAYLFDSDVVIRYLASDDEVMTQIRPLFTAGCFVSVISYIEIRQGLLTLTPSTWDHAEFDRFIADAPLIPVTRAVAERCAKVRAELAMRGSRVRSRALDLIIAATAMHHGLILVTRNVTDYRDIPDLEVG